MMNKADNFILIESFKYDNKELIEFQQFDKRGNLLEHKTRIQLEKEWEEEAKQEIPDDQESEFFDEANQYRVSISNFWESGIQYKCLDKSFLDENGRVFKHEHYENGELACSVVHEFDGKGNHIAIVWRNAALQKFIHKDYIKKWNRKTKELGFMLSTG
ncbi:MAG: hypothetical protein LBR10_01905 [Prevotellaceae bacterium]|jgi:hypothetical protein|nr:hypothetical protein [Prevotellaceae bacterium]